MLITSTKQVKEKNRRKVAHNIHRYRVSKCENEKNIHENSIRVLSLFSGCGC